MKEIKVINARQNNLKGISVSIPYNGLCVVTGDSGSGKSSLVYDTVYAESQRLMSESLIDSTFGMKLMDEPNVEAIENLCPAINISQLSYNFNPNSTIGTYTGVSSNLQSIFAIVSCTTSNVAMAPRDFSLLHSRFKCPKCNGTRKQFVLSLEKLIPNKSLTLSNGGITFFSGPHKSFEMQLLKQICERHNIDMDIPIEELTQRDIDLLLYGTSEDKYVIKFERGSKKNCQKTIQFEGVMHILEKEYRKINSPMIQKQLGRYLKTCKCDECAGTGFQPAIRGVLIEGYNISDLFDAEIDEVGGWCSSLTRRYRHESFYHQLHEYIRHIHNIINSVQSLNIGYLSLSRSIPSLSGGEFQRLRLARQTAGSLVGVLYILDEPCRGLHRVDIKRIVEASKAVVNKGNTVLAIEHNKEFIASADKIIELGPQGGPLGGYVIKEGVPSLENDIFHAPAKQKRTSDEYLCFDGIYINNIQNESCNIPLHAITCITGVSGSGKTTLAEQVIYRSLEENTNINCRCCKLPRSQPKAYYVDQKPIGKNARSSVISYLKIYDEIRDIFSKIEYAGKRYKSAFFSVNCEGGRCEKCAGTGVISPINQQFSDYYVTCDECNGNRFLPFILNIRYKGKNINDVMQLTVHEALELFSDNAKIASMLSFLEAVGLEYLQLGQMSKNLSGGEAQRLKLAKALGENRRKSSIYILDEPTSGMSSRDIDKLSILLQRLVDNGNTVVAVEHNIKFISENADFIIDFGFHGGKPGGKIVDQGYACDVFSRKKASIWYDEEMPIKSSTV